MITGFNCSELLRGDCTNVAYNWFSYNSNGVPPKIRGFWEIYNEKYPDAIILYSSEDEAKIEQLDAIADEINNLREKIPVDLEQAMEFVRRGVSICKGPEGVKKLERAIKSNTGYPISEEIYPELVERVA